MTNKILYYLSRNYYVWLVYVFIFLPFRILFVFVMECGKIIYELCNDLKYETKHLKSHWENQKKIIEQRIKKGE